ncbi:hypothetical protein C0Q70_11080 [Pomacea canaliculata]|uniref:Armadillo repeat-containing protein 2 n=2 Tax=Pomacea canaliculata TaxID=400727 RepID=A0A2T7P4Z0_POMCA|nr:hypothetical protein C0Q70_11080 [Pomacea canaliculata]
MQESTMDLGQKKSTLSRPFYEPPENKATSSQIINEARSSLRTLGATRPFTPRDEQRHLFPTSTNRTPESRPPSSFSLNSRHFEGPDSRPVSGTRLSPLDHAPRTTGVADLESILPPKPPTSDPNRPPSRRSANSRHRIYSQQNSDVTSVYSREGSAGSQRSGCVADAKEENLVHDKPIVRAHSGPKERTQPLLLEDEGSSEVKEATVRLAGSANSPPSSAGSHRSGSGGTRRSSIGQSRTGSLGRLDEDTDELYNQKVAPMLEQMAALSKKKDCDRFLVLAGNLYNLLEENNCLGKHFHHRSTVLKVIFKLLDVEEPRLLLKLARLILAFRVGGNNLLNVCKLVFKVSRNEKNDSYFLEENLLNLLLDTIRGADHQVSCEALIYCVGAVKFLTGNATILKRLARLDCIKVLATLMHNIIKTNKETGKVGDQFGHILVQLAAALRNLADTNSGREQFISHHVVEGLTVLIETYPNDSDLMLYISRIFSKVTLHTDCSTALADQHGCYKSFVSLLKRYLKKEDLVVRLCFVLGNLTAKNEQARQRLFQEKDALDVLLNVLRTYNDMDKQGAHEVPAEPPLDESTENTSSINKVEDVLIKVIRVLANLSISEDVGPFIAASPQCITNLLHIIERKDITESEELILNCVAAVNNLTYYTTKQSTVTPQHLTIAQSMLKLVLTSNMEAILETARVFGNLTRHKPVRDFLSEKKVDAIMVTLLDSGNRELVYVACGVLINFMIDEERRPLLKQEGGVTKCIEVLRDFGREDWQLCSTVCKVLCNYSTHMTSSANTFGHKEAQLLSDLLIEYLDKDAALDLSQHPIVVEDEVKAYIHEIWETDFCPVASQLLRRIELHQCDLEPLEAPG